MKTFLLLLLFVNCAFAGTKTRILHVSMPEHSGDTYEVLVAKNKSTLQLLPSNQELVKKVLHAEEFNSVVDLELNGNIISSLTVLEEGDNLLDFYPDEGLHPMTGYTPSNVDSMELAELLFKSLKKRTKWFTQCFNRAHVWAKQMYDSHQVKSMKILIYYTKKYRREIDGKWWFHIAPMIDVNGTYYVMDKEFTRKPVTDSEWESIFKRKMEAKGIYGYRCKVIQNIKEYYDDYNQKNEYCNIQVTSMYYWEPNDMSRLDKTGKQKSEFLNRELRIATKEIFWKWRKVYNQIKVRNQ